VCEPHTAFVHEQVGRTYPLSAYLDMRSLKAHWPHIVRYTDWCENVLKKDVTVKQDDGYKGGPKRWIMPVGLCAELHWHECYPQHAPKIIGDFVFTKIEYGRGTDFDKQLTTLKDDSSTTLFFYYAYRRYWDKLRFGRVGGSEFGPGYPNVPFNAGHLRAAKDYIEANFGSGQPLTVFHWRSEHVDEAMLEPCAGQLAEMLGGLKWPSTPSGARALLLSDMAAPNHRHILVRGAPQSLVAVVVLAAIVHWRHHVKKKDSPLLIFLSAANLPRPPSPLPHRSGTRTWAPS
jgi:hypothetical protein